MPLRATGAAARCVACAASLTPSYAIATSERHGTDHDQVVSTYSSSTAAVSRTAVLAHRRRKPFGYIGLAERQGRRRWRHPVLLLLKTEFGFVEPVERIGRAIGGPLLVNELPFGHIQPGSCPVPQRLASTHAINQSLEIWGMKLLNARLLDEALILVLDGSAQNLFSAKTVLARPLGCDVHLATPGMMTRLRSAYKKSGESVLDSLARFAVIEDLGGKSVTQEPVIVRRNGARLGAAMFRGTRVPPGPIFSMLAEMNTEEITCRDYPSVSKADIEMALQQACHLLEREAPWVDVS